MKRPSLRSAMSFAVLFLLLTGCGVDSDARVQVRGTVRYRNQMLASGTVVFVPDIDRGTPNELAIGQIKSDGTFELQTDKGASLAPGWYRVTIVAGFASDSTMRLALPDKYRDPIRSGLEREIKAGQGNAFEFKLE